MESAMPAVLRRVAFANFGVENLGFSLLTPTRFDLERENSALRGRG